MFRVLSFWPSTMRFCPTFLLFVGPYIFSMNWLIELEMNSWLNVVKSLPVEQNRERQRRRGL